MSVRSVVVIGGGISGVLVARELLLAGFEVTILEGLHLGAGSSSRTAAGIRQQFSTPSTVHGMRYALSAYQALSEEFGARCLEQGGYLFLHDDPSAWAQAKDRVHMQQRHGVADVEALEGDALRARFGFVADEMLGGTYCPTDGFLHPEVVYQEGAARVRALGGRIAQRAKVCAAAWDGDRIVRVKTETHGWFEADVFVDCTNAWTDQLAMAIGATVLPVSPMKRYLWFVRRAGGMSGDDLLDLPMVIAPTGVYGRPENADTLMMGWARGGTPEPGFTPEDQDVIEPRFAHDGGIDAEPFDAWMHLAEAVPPIGAFDGVVATSSGYYGVTPDHNPFLGYDPKARNLVRLVGFSGHGAMFGPFTAFVGRALVEAGRDLPVITLPTGEVDMAAFALGRGFDRVESMVI